MTLKTRLRARLSRIQEYRQNVLRCRDIRMAIGNSVNDMTVTVGADSMDKIVACIKACYTFVRPVNSMDAFAESDVMCHVKFCPCFDDEKCALYGCAYRYKKMKYQKQQSMLRDAIEQKNLSFRRMFERIK